MCVCVCVLQTSAIKADLQLTFHIMGCIAPFLYSIRTVHKAVVNTERNKFGLPELSLKYS